VVFSGWESVKLNMDFTELNKLTNEAMAAAKEGRLSPKSNEELDALLSACRQNYAANPYAGVWGPTLDALQHEIERRANERAQAETEKRHEAAMKESERIHSAVQKLHKPHWSLTPSFVVIVLTMIFAAIAAWPVIREWFPVSQPANKDASSPPPQSNSTPANITATQTLPVAPALMRGTNHP
jgi:hypothetical protein